MMKVLINILLLAGAVLCEVPPPYPARGFKPNPPFNLPVRQPQTAYGPPNSEPSKFSLHSPQTQYGVPNPQGTKFSPAKFSQLSPQTQYGVPNPQGTRFSPAQFSQLSPQTQYGVPNPQPNLTPSFSSKQTIPSTSYGVPAATASPYKTIVSETQTTFGAVRPSSDLTPNFNSKQQIPSTSYGVPAATASPYKTIVSEAQTTFGAVRPSSDLTPNFNSKQKIPSTSYGVPVTATPYRTINEPQLAHNQNNRPSSQYGAVNTDETNIETLEQIKQLNLLLQLSQSGKSNRNNPNLFQNQESSKNVVIPSQQYLPVKEPTNFRKGFDLSSNQGGSYDVGLSNRNGNQQPSDHYLPANQVSNSNFPQIPAQNRNTNTALPGSQNINPNLNGFNSPAQNIEIERLNVRRLPNLNSNEQNQNRAQSTLNSVRQNKDLGYTQNGEQIGEGYLPPALPAPTTRPTIYRPATSRPASVPSDGPAGNDQPTVFKDAAGPNVSVATAVAGTPGEQRFYVLQPDGSLQRVIFQKTRTESDRENEYTANYIFQNVQPDPELGYK